MNQYSALLFSLRSMSVYRATLEDPAVRALTGLLGARADAPLEASRHYGELLRSLLESDMSLSDYIYSTVLYDNNVFTRRCARGQSLPDALLEAAAHDLRVLMRLAYLTSGDLCALLKERCPSLANEIDALPGYTVGHTHFVADEDDWANEIKFLREFCHENGCGEDARFRAQAADGETA